MPGADPAMEFPCSPLIVEVAAFKLMRRGRDAPKKAGWKAQFMHRITALSQGNHAQCGERTFRTLVDFGYSSVKIDIRAPAPGSRNSMYLRANIPFGHDFVCQK